jgi:sigma-B regulation protein RsbU (phosphoserine phosphatase)
LAQETEQPFPAGASETEVLATGASLTPELKLRLLLQIAHEGYATLDLDQLLDHLLDLVDTIVPYDAAGIFVLSRELIDLPQARRRQLIAGVARRGFDDLPVETDPMLMLGQGIIGHVIHTGRPRLASDVTQDPRYVAGRKATRSEIAVPVIVGERVIGALNLENDRRGAFDEGHLDALRFFATAAAISIEKALLHRQLMEKQRLEEQLHIARQVQDRLLPAVAPEVPGYDLAGVCIPSHEIGGDVFDYIPLPGGRLGLLVADVSGKGVPAALIMSAFRALVRAYCRQEQDLGRLAATVNRHLLDSTGHEDFITCLYGVLEPETGRFRYVNCGHNPPLLLRAGGESEPLGGGNLVLGLFAGTEFQPDRVTLAPGDRLLLYTDGVVDCEDVHGAAFGIGGILSVAGSAAHPTSTGLITSLVAAARSFSQSDHFSDDFTLLALHRHP